MIGKVGVTRILRRPLTNMKGILLNYASFFLVTPRLTPKLKVEIMVKIMRKTGTSVTSRTITHIIACDVLYAHGMYHAYAWCLNKTPCKTHTNTTRQKNKQVQTI